MFIIDFISMLKTPQLFDLLHPYTRPHHLKHHELRRHIHAKGWCFFTCVSFEVINQILLRKETEIFRVIWFVQNVCISITVQEVF